MEAAIQGRSFPLRLCSIQCMSFAPALVPNSSLPSLHPSLPLPQCYSDPTHVLRNYLAEQNMVTIVISGGDNATDSRYYQIHPFIKPYKHGVAQPGQFLPVPCNRRSFLSSTPTELINKIRNTGAVITVLLELLSSRCCVCQVGSHCSLLLGNQPQLCTLTL